MDIIDGTLLSFVHGSSVQGRWMDFDVFFC
jgi:hypothetical protein